MKIGVVIGTRPEAIKMAPVILELRKRNIPCVVIATAQHRELLDQPLSYFKITPDYDLNIMQENQDVFYITNTVLELLKPVLLKEMPDMLLVQGDTTTTFASSLAAFYCHIPVGHIEAGLRTWDKTNPFPEEINRQLTTRIATLHFAPTSWAKQNLLKEGITPGSIIVTGNTGIDSLLMISNAAYSFTNSVLQKIDFVSKKIILLTTHRRENFGEPMREIFSACKEIVELHNDVEIVYPVHPNPNVQHLAHQILGGTSRIHLIPPLEYVEFVHLMKQCYFILSDSGGIQEEAPSLGKPVLVLRKTTERPEAIDAGTAILTGTDKNAIIREAQLLLKDDSNYRSMQSSTNPYGTGHASEHIIDAVTHFCTSTSK